MGTKTYRQQQLEAQGGTTRVSSSTANNNRIVSRYRLESGFGGLRALISIVIIGLAGDLTSRARQGGFQSAAVFNLSLVGRYLMSLPTHRHTSLGQLYID